MMLFSGAPNKYAVTGPVVADPAKEGAKQGKAGPGPYRTKAGTGQIT